MSLGLGARAKAAAAYVVAAATLVEAYHDDDGGEAGIRSGDIFWASVRESERE